jgi:transposase
MKQLSAVQAPRTIGLDLGSKKSVYCTLDGESQVVAEGSVPTRRGELSDFFRAQPLSRIVMEASGPCRWISALAASFGHEVIVGNPREIHLISKSYRKNDRNDAFKLADLGQVRPRLLHPVQLRCDRAHLGQVHQRARTQLVAMRTHLVNLVRGCARTSGHAMPACSTRVFRARCQELLPADLKQALAPVLDQLHSLNEAIARYDKETERLGEELFPATKALRQVAGVGPVLSLAFVCAIDDPSRFEDSRTVPDYFGLVPRSRQSGDYNPQLRISKRGDPEVRRLLVSAATYILGPFGPDTDLRRFGERIQKAHGQAGRAKARIAVARKLAVLLHRLWITGEVYKPLRNSEVSS